MPRTFGQLLRQHRLQARMTQEALAEATQLSVHSISNLERDVPHRPRPDTLQRLTDALHLSPHDHATLLQAAYVLSCENDASSVPASASTHADASGRDEEIRAVLELLRHPTQRLVTITGMGGVGKTWLARTVLAQITERACFVVELASLTDADDLVLAIAEATGMSLAAEVSLVTLQTHLESRPTLLLLDNCEHLLAATPLIQDLLAGLPSLRILVTSRIALQVSGEIIYPLAPLPIPDLEDADTEDWLDRVAANPSIRLLLRQAQLAAPSCSLTAANARALVALCQRTDGLPLAIQIVASRLALLTPTLLLAQLDRQMTVLRMQTSHPAARFPSVEATLEWSYRLLSLQEQQIFRRLGVVVGGCSFEAAANLCQGIAEPHEAVDLLADLVTHHFVERQVIDDLEGETIRLSLLETVRAYALLQLRACAEVEDVERLHAEYYLSFAEQCAAHLTGADQVLWILWLKREYPNLLAALRWAEQREEITLGFRLVVALRVFWMGFHPITEGRTWTATFLQLETRKGEGVDSFLKAEVYNAAGTLAFSQGELSAAKEYHQHSLRLRMEVGDKAQIAVSLNNLALVAKQEGEIAQAEQLQQESVALKREIGDTLGLAMSLMNLGNLARGQGQYAEAETYYRECLYLYRTLGHAQNIAGALGSLGRIASAYGDTQQAVIYLEEALHLFQRLGAQRELAATYINLGEVYGVQREVVTAQSMISNGLKIAREMGLQTFVVDGLECLAEVLFQATQINQATSLLAAAAFLREMLHYALSQQDQQRITRLLERAQEVLGETAYGQAWTRGSVADIDHLIAQSALPA